MSNKEIEDLKTLIKALEIRLQADEISEAEYKEIQYKTSRGNCCSQRTQFSKEYILRVNLRFRESN